MSVCRSPGMFACMCVFSWDLMHLDLDGVSAEKLKGGHGVEMERDNLSRIHGKKKYPGGQCALVSAVSVHKSNVTFEWPRLQHSFFECCVQELKKYSPSCRRSRHRPR